MTTWLTVAAFAAAVPCSLRWLRVAQREHYLAGAGVRFTSRWWRVGPNPALGLFIVGGAVAAWWLPPVGLVALAGAALGPIGLSLRGQTGRLRWTARLLRLAALLGVFWLVPASIGAWTDRPVLAVAAVVVMPGLADLAMAATYRFERRLGDKWVNKAERALRQSGARVVAITGSFGKTTTKAYLAHLLGGLMSVVASPASFNNRMGLARAINEGLAPGTEVLIAEMGTYGKGEIADLCEFVSPEVAVITGIGPVHLERFGSEGAIVAAKREILERAEVAVLNVDRPALADLAAEEEGRRRVIRCSTVDRRADVFVDASMGEIAAQGRQIGKAPGLETFASNLACAIGAVVGLGLEVSRVAHRLGDLPTPPHRTEVGVSERGVTVIDDTYNSNPSGARAALATLTKANGNRRVVVTPGMVELGHRQHQENLAFADEAAAVATEVLVVGRTNRTALLEGARRGPASVMVMPSRQAAVEWVRGHLGPGDAVLYENDLPDHYP